MQDLIDRLEYAMAGELEVYVGLLQYAKRKKTALIDNDVDELGRLVRLENEQLGRLQELSGQREQLFAAIAAEDAYAGKVTFNYLVLKLAPEERQRIEALRARYKDAVGELEELNGLNQSLLSLQLQYTAFCMGALTRQEGAAGATYGSKGYIREENEVRRLIDQEA